MRLITHHSKIYTKIHTKIRAAVAVAFVTVAGAGCDDVGDEWGEHVDGHLDERSRPAAVGTQCGTQEWIEPDGSLRETPVVYYFDHINAQLRDDPKLRELSGLEQVHTCADAERFGAALRDNEEPATIDEAELIPDFDALSVEEPEQSEHPQFRIHQGDATDKPGIVWINERCSGVFITHRHILTAAHCFYSGGDQLVSVREDEIGSANRNAYVHIHPDYTGGFAGLDVNDDIAIISLSRNVWWTPAPHRFYTGVTQTGTQLHIYGYGARWYNGSEAGVLREALGGTPINLNYHSGGYFRAYAHTARFCDGDSGGPAIDESSAFDITWGLASQSDYVSGRQYACPQQGFAMRWTKTNAKASWIADRLQENPDGDFTCHPFSYGNGRSYFRCW